MKAVITYSKNITARATLNPDGTMRKARPCMATVTAKAPEGTVDVNGYKVPNYVFTAYGSTYDEAKEQALEDASLVLGSVDTPDPEVVEV